MAHAILAPALYKQLKKYKFIRYGKPVLLITILLSSTIAISLCYSTLELSFVVRYKKILASSASLEELATTALRLQDSLKTLAFNSQTQLTKPRVTVFANPDESLQIYSEKENFLFRVNSGDVYTSSGRFLKTTEPIENLPLVTFFTTLSDTFSQDPELIKSTLALIDALRDHTHQPLEILFHPHLGFSFRLRTLSTIVIRVGFSPFNEKIDRLLDLISHKSFEPLSIREIDLDHNNKAILRTL